MTRKSLIPILAGCMAAGPLAADPILPPAFDATGTWSAEVTIGGVAQALTIVLHRRDDGSLLGYVAGGSVGRTMTGGLQAGTALTFDVELADPVMTRTLTFSGDVGPNTLVGELDENGVTIPVSFSALKPELLERRFLFAAESGGDAGPPAEVAVASRQGKGTFVSGAFVGRHACDLFACGGTVTGFSTGDDGLGNETVSLVLATGGDCPGEGTLEATFDETTRLYNGSYSFQDCADAVPEVGNVVGVRTTRTTSSDAAAVLDTFARLADALEAGAVLGPSDMPLTPDYLHLGATIDDRLAGFNAEIAGYANIDVALSRFRNLHTVSEPFAFEEAPTRFGVDFSDRRNGEAGGVPTMYRDVDTARADGSLRFLAASGNDWLIHGNQVSHDLPIAGYTLGAAHVITPGEATDVYVSLGPFGAHHLPHSGHLEGNAKADWMGLYATALDELTALDGGDGTCDPGDTCGIAAADITAGMVDYVVPAAPLQITHAWLERLESPGIYFGTDEHWRVHARTAYYTYEFVHLAGISTDLRDAMMNAGYVDPWTVHVPSDNLVAGAPVTLEPGEAIARPQVVAEEIPGHPGWFRGRFGAPQTPWLQMEFFTRNERTGRQVAFYDWLAPSLRDSLEAIFQAEASDPASFRYDQPFLVDRRWRAEMAMAGAGTMSRDDYSQVYSALGGWWENTPGACDGASVHCDELFALFPIRKDTPFYDATLYHSPSVSWLAVHAFHDDMPPARYGEVVAPAAPDPVSDMLTIRWRDVDGAHVGYQGVAYSLDPAAQVLRLAWGALAAFEGTVIPPAMPAVDDACDGVNLTCHDHDRPNGDAPAAVIYTGPGGLANQNNRRTPAPITSTSRSLSNWVHSRYRATGPTPKLIPAP